MTAELTFTMVASMANYAALGAMWNLGNVSFKKYLQDGGEKMVWRRLLQALVLGAGAGALVAMWGEPADPGMFEVAMATVVPLADKLYNAYNAGIETYHESDDGDDENTDEVRKGVKAGLADFVASNPEAPNIDGPQRTPDEVDAETGAPIDMSLDDEPQTRHPSSLTQSGPRSRSTDSGDDDTETVQYGP